MSCRFFAHIDHPSLARNSAKFVTCGFVRLRAIVNNNNEVTIFVEDSGPGIPEDKRKHLFQKFQQSLDSLSQGTGIGLSLCQSLVTLLGGDIYLDENYNSGVDGYLGARFVIDLKQCPEFAQDEQSVRSNLDLEEGSSTAPDASSPGEGKDEAEDYPLPERLRLLFVDDDRVLRRLASRAISKVAPGWTVREAASGEAAIRLLEESGEGPPDIIFVDQYMTSVDHSLLGTETIRSMRASGVQSIMVGLSANELGDVFQRAGADSFILKPFPCKVPELVPLLGKLLRDHRRPIAAVEQAVRGASGDPPFSAD